MHLMIFHHWKSILRKTIHVITIEWKPVITYFECKNCTFFLFHQKKLNSLIQPQTFELFPVKFYFEQICDE